MRNSIKRNFIQALKAREKFTCDVRQRVQDLVSHIHIIKEETEQKAMALGVAQFCRLSIDICKGECCRLHFPKTFTAVDFLIAMEGLTPTQCENLRRQIIEHRRQNKKCIFLNPYGCVLSFQNRPMVCTNAYPCFANREYWEFKEAGNKKAEPIFKSLDKLIQPMGRRRSEYIC